MALEQHEIEQLKEVIREVTIASHSSITSITSNLGNELKKEISVMKLSQERQEQNQEEMKKNVGEIKEVVDGLVIDKAKMEGGKVVFLGTVSVIFALVGVIYVYTSNRISNLETSIYAKIEKSK